MADLVVMAATMAIEQKQKQKAAKNTQAVADSQAAQIKQARAQAEKSRRYQLKKDLAARRAQQGASGIGGVGGSNEAVLGGLTRLAEEDINKGTEAMNQRLAKLRSRMDRDVLAENQDQQRQVLSSGQTLINQLQSQ